MLHRDKYLLTSCNDNNLLTISGTRIVDASCSYASMLGISKIDLQAIFLPFFEIAAEGFRGSRGPILGFSFS